jgi:hypothetical protein
MTGLPVKNVSLMIRGKAGEEKKCGNRSYPRILCTNELDLAEVPERIF